MMIHCKGQLIDLSSPKIMGIINITPDSFYDGGSYTDEKKLLLQVEKMMHEGAHFIDVGGYSSRPGANMVSENEEYKRVVPAIRCILKYFPEALISVDTFRSRIAKASIESGAALINDISAGNIDEDMMRVVASYQLPYIMMHMRGTPQNMQQHTKYNMLVKDILLFFSQKIAEARALGINDLIIDPGFGFSKTLSQNYELLNQMELFEILELPVLVGISRKSMIYKLLGSSPQEALNGTTCLHSIALLKGAAILRVHDVKAAVECTRLIYELTATS